MMHWHPSVQYSLEHLVLEANCKDDLDLPACFPQGPEGFINVGFAPPTGNKGALRSRLALEMAQDYLIHTWSMQLGLICMSNKSNLGPEQTRELKC